jgi:hypothetical protein
MNALPELKPITTRVIRSPRYHNAQVRDFNRWYPTNEPLLIQYWNELGAALSPNERQEVADYWEFVAVQHDREQMRVAGEFGLAAV